MSKKILILGLDGATFDIITPLIEEGWMPNLKGLIENGASGPLQSTIPPVTGPAWLSLATGMTPGKTGVFDFLKRTDESYNLHGLSSQDYVGRSVWDYLSQAGKQVGILNYPLLRPPYKINGFMTTGIGASRDEEITCPKSLKREIEQVVEGEYELVVPYNNPRYDDTELFLEDLNRVFNKHVRATEYLLTEKKWNLFWVVFSETDWLQHLMWHHIDSGHPLHGGEKSKPYARKFKKFWTRIDEAIGRFLHIVGQETTVIILSDHGFGPNDQTFNLNLWLERTGYLVRKEKKEQSLNLVKAAIWGGLREIAGVMKLKKWAPGLYKYGIQALDSLTVNVLDQIDLQKSLAFDPGHTNPLGGIYINDALVGNLEERKAVADEITEKLKAYGDKQNIKMEVLKPEELYNCPRNKAPDLLIKINDWRCIMKKDFKGDKIFESKSYSPRHTGSHRMNGIFVAKGPAIRETELHGAEIYDVAPTVLHFFGQQIPKGIDGRVLEEIYESSYLKKHPVQFMAEKSRSDREAVSTTLSEKEEAVLQKRLRDLGYM